MYKCPHCGKSLETLNTLRTYAGFYTKQGDIVEEEPSDDPFIYCPECEEELSPDEISKYEQSNNEAPNPSPFWWF